MHYLDNSATTPVDPRVIEVISDTLKNTFGNPSSLYDLGVMAQLVMEDCEQPIKQALGVRDGDVIFTSGGTEANNLAIFGTANAKKRRGQHIITTAVEHPSVKESIETLERDYGFCVTRILPNSSGNISVEDVTSHIRKDTVLISVMHVNNETGAVFPIEDIAKQAKRENKDIVIHTDAVQSFCKLPINIRDIDIVTISGHKISAPKGVGALYIKKGVLIKPLIYGGGQQKRIRPGTENTAYIAGFMTATRLHDKKISEHTGHVKALKERLIGGISGIDGIVINSPVNSAPYIVNLSVVGIKSETMLHSLEAKGVYVSSGSACSKGAKSHVLSAIGLEDKYIDSALRISFSHNNTEEDIDALIDGIKQAMVKLARKR